MTYLRQEIEDAEARVIAAKAETHEYFVTLRSKASDVIKSPIVLGGGLLGVAAAGYALFTRYKSPSPKSGPTRPLNLANIFRVTSALVPLIAAIVSRPSRPAEAPASVTGPEDEGKKIPAFTHFDNSAVSAEHTSQTGHDRRGTPRRSK